MPETTVLILAVFLHGLHILVGGILTNRSPEGRAWNASPRDLPPPPLGEMAGRARRATDNHLTALVLFTAAVAAVGLRGEASSVTAACAWTFLGARLLYLPAYLYGWTPWRSLIWMAGFVATLVMLLATLF